MKTNELVNSVAEIIRTKILTTQMSLVEKVNLLIAESRERELKSTAESEKEFHKGVQAGMKYILILIINLEI